MGQDTIYGKKAPDIYLLKLYNMERINPKLTELTIK